jgi:hypothetical protein
MVTEGYAVHIKQSAVADAALYVKCIRSSAIPMMCFDVMSMLHGAMQSSPQPSGRKEEFPIG